MKYTKEQILKHIKDTMCIEYDALNDQPVYYIHINEDGDLVSDLSRAETTLTYGIDNGPWKDDEDPERFYEEFETPDNPEFAELLDRMTADVNAAVEEILEWKRIEEENG